MRHLIRKQRRMNLARRITSSFLAFLLMFTSVIIAMESAVIPVFASAVPAVFELKWTSPQDETYRTYDENGVIQLTPSENAPDLSTAGTAAQATVTFSLGGETPAQTGEVQIRMPQYIFESRSGTSQGVISIGVSDQPGGATGFYHYIDTDSHEIVITNYMELDPGYVFKCDIVYHSTNGTDQYPSQIKDQYYTEFDASVLVTLGESTPITTRTNKLALRYHTDAKIDSLTKSAISPVKYETWQNQWGATPVDAADYFYLVWHVRLYTYAKCTQPFSITLTDTPDENGEVMGIGRLSALNNCVGVTTIPIVSHDRPETIKQSENYYVLTRHPRSALINNNGSFVNNIKATLTGVDGASDEKTASNTYKYKGVDFKYPGDLYTLYKNYNNKNYSAFINKLENAQTGSPVAVGTFYPYANARGWRLTLEEGANSTDPENYGKLPYSIELTDDLVVLGNEQLKKDDYAFSTFSVTLDQYNYAPDEKTGSWAEISDADYESWQPVTIEYQTEPNGTWNTLGTARRLSSNSYQFTDTQGIISNMDVNNPITLPVGVTGVRAKLDTTFYKASLRLYLTTEIYPTDRVLSLIDDVDEVRLHNVGTLRVFDSEGNWVNQAAIPTNDLSSIIIARDQASYGEDRYATHGMADKILTRYNSNSKIEKTVTYTNDTNKGIVKASYRADMAEYFSGASQWDTEDFLSSGMMPLQSHGVIYDLLPLGMNVDISSSRYGHTKQRTTKPITLCLLLIHSGVNIRLSW